MERKDPVESVEKKATMISKSHRPKSRLDCACFRLHRMANTKVSNLKDCGPLILVDGVDLIEKGRQVARRKLTSSIDVIHVMLKKRMSSHS